MKVVFEGKNYEVKICEKEVLYLLEGASEWKSVKLIRQSEEEWKEHGLESVAWYGKFVRGVTYGTSIYFRENGFFLFQSSRVKVILHELWHIISGKGNEGHTNGLLDISSWHGLGRL